MQKMFTENALEHNDDPATCTTDGFFNDLRDMRVEQRFRYDFPLRVNVERLLKTCFNFMRDRIRRQPQNKNDPSCRTVRLIGMFSTLSKSLCVWTPSFHGDLNNSQPPMLPEQNLSRMQAPKGKVDPNQKSMLRFREFRLTLKSISTVATNSNTQKNG